MEGKTRIKDLITKNRLKQYEVAHELGVSEFTLCKWLRYEQEIPEEKEEQILNAIRNLANQGDGIYGK